MEVEASRASIEIGAERRAWVDRVARVRDPLLAFFKARPPFVSVLGVPKGSELRLRPSD
jgi:hypothetical protein